MKITIEIENLKCKGCANTIKKSISKMNGVKNVEVVFEPESVAIEYDEKEVNRDDFVQLLSKLGYPEKGNNTLIKNVKSYVSCAIGRVTKKEE
ncbi:MAG TPA: heavy-metal-associated domain-containing protein [Bacteroidales bacterium]|jgi:copper chaperone CopZ|nr:heavy-metal-associated domain-containing protein [Bacteroidales bacterium]